VKIEEVTRRNELRLGMTRNVYAVNEKGEYTTVPEGWESEIIIGPSLEEICHERAQLTLQRVAKGEASPLEYYMHLRLMDVSDLARAMGIAAWRVKRHMRPAVFQKMSEEMLGRYAEVLKLSVEELKRIKGGE
jgi:hypothetical protein